MMGADGISHTFSSCFFNYYDHHIVSVANDIVAKAAEFSEQVINDDWPQERRGKTTLRIASNC